MGHSDITRGGSGFLSRLLRDQGGNTIAILAAAVVPVIGLVGGGVDMSRIYLAQSRLQGACDAGSLMGRKVMGAGTWAANSNNANTQALKLFDMNYKGGDYGTTGLTRSFTETAGNVQGTATVEVPMAMMQVLGTEKKTITVTCQAELRIPNTDVMFVLDTTGSMSGTASGSSETKISGLRKAVKCFYEALAKRNIDDVTPAQCGETADPSTSNVGSVQLRFGFVPYAVNVNVGKLLPLDYMANQWTYQSRQAETETVTSGTPVYGTESGHVNYDTDTDSLSSTSWAATEENVIQGSKTFTWQINNIKESECDALHTSARPVNVTATTNGPREYVSQNPANPTHPTSSVTRYYEQVSITERTEYRYDHSGNKKNGTCTLEYRKSNRSAVTVKTRTTVPVTYNTVQQFAGWRYKPVTFNVSALKDTSNNSWRSSVSLPLGTNGVPANIAWAGCIEERQTYRAPDGDPSDDWNPIPSGAHDMNIDLAPSTSDSATLWGPLLTGAVWERYTLDSDQDLTNTRTRSEVFVDKDWGITMPAAGSNCPTESKLYQTWTPTAYKNYINGLSIGGNTYHDIGLLWGARLMSPTGIFAALNAPANTTIERHMIFMTDGETNVINDDYSAYGVHWYDRRQTVDSSAPSNTLLNSVTDARTAAICQAVRNKNITLWVVSFGDVDAATNTRLAACATPGKFFHATSVATLVTNFKAIAAEISALRLTQ